MLIKDWRDSSIVGLKTFPPCLKTEGGSRVGNNFKAMSPLVAKQLDHNR